MKIRRTICSPIPLAGLLGRNANSTSTLNLINEDSVTESWITPMNTCPLWQYNYGNNRTVAWGTHYLPPITARLNKILAAALPKPGVQLTTSDVHGALYACAYDYAAFKTSPWCGVFTEQEILDFEYELDLLMQGAFGYGLPGSMGPQLGRLYTRKLVERYVLDFFFLSPSVPSPIGILTLIVVCS